MLEVLKPIFIEVFKNSTVELTEETVASDIHGWDSLGHLRLMMAIEKKFKVRFSASEISSLKNVGDICILLTSKKISA